MSSPIRPFPLDPLSADEIRRATAIIREKRGTDTNYVFNMVTLKEPSKLQMMPYLGWENSSLQPKPVTIDREVFVLLVDRPSGLVHEVTVNLDKNAVTNWNKVEGRQPTLNVFEMLEAEKEILKDERVKDQCRQLGITDISMVYADPWGVGYHEIKGRRLVQALMYARTSPDDNQYAHPLDFNPLYDINAKKVIDIVVSKRRNSNFERPVIPMMNHHFLPEHLGKDRLRKDIKPIEVTQPEGVSFSIRNGYELHWQKWNMHLSFNSREGLVINNISYCDMDGTVRPIIYRMSLAEMVVPYANPYKPYNHKMAFDVGEYGLGNLTNSLELGCDCVGKIYYLNAVLNDLNGDPWHIPNAICIHEEDTGLLFKHTDYRTGKAHSARSRRLVISHIVTAANYDYGLYYYFYQDGTIQYEVKATGELNTQVLAADEDAAPYGTIVAPQVDAQHHQHLFSMRIDPMIDGVNNSVAEVDVVASDLPVGHPHNSAGNSFYPVTKVFETTDEAKTMAIIERHRTWKIINESKIHPYAKQPVGFKMMAHPTPPLLPKPGSIVYERAMFASKTLWVTPHNEEQRYPGGYYCYQSEPSENLGLPQWTKETQNVRDTDIVCWLTFGLTHIPRVEDFPIMPIETCGIMLKPANFFLGNPGIDIPSSTRHSTKSAYANDAPCCRKNNL